MTIKLLPKYELALRNKQSLNYNLAIAEKDYFLTIVSKVINESELSKKLVFKGGTAIHHCYLPQSRFSEDLDFSCSDNSVSLEEVKKVLISQPFLELKDRDTYVSKATIKVERLKYSGVLDQPSSLKVEIDFIQNVILPTQDMPYANAWGVDVTVRVMDIREICAEKIRAMSDRARYRDFYDFYLIMEKYAFNLPEIYGLLKQKEVRKIVSKESILENWQLVREAKLLEKSALYYQDDVVDHDDKVEKVLSGLSFDPIPVNSAFDSDAS